jgi:D-arabinose 1-dehydrogenase-like Zn-dependent alcohol dehydrogenase
VVFGIGGLESAIIKSFGAEVIAVDIAEDKLEFARTLGPLPPPQKSH